MTVIMAKAETFSYHFNSTPLTSAIRQIIKDHPKLNINFIFNELETYKTSATIKTDNPLEALRTLTAMNPVTISHIKNTYYIEPLQHGKYRYHGRTVGTDGQPVVAATVFILSPNDSTVLTYGITDNDGRFSIPCDRQGVIGKITSTGFKPTYRRFESFSVGTIVMTEKAIALKEVKVETDNALMYPDKTIYIPTTRQKNASQTGSDLLDHMAIPQLGMVSNNKVSTVGGQPIALFIDYIPASETDLKAMRVGDVKRVEFCEYPSDPRFQGNTYVINFIMQKYEYGGYVKAFGHANLISNQLGDLLGSARMQYKKMTYDLMASVSGYDRDHDGSELTETYRLPQPDGEIKEFNRFTNTTSSRHESQWYYTTFRAIYNSEKLQASSQIEGRIDNSPHKDQSGSVSYSSDAFPGSTYVSSFKERSKDISYKGQYFFSLPKNNSITFSPTLGYSHTNQNSYYFEEGFNAIHNGATDNTGRIRGDLRYNHNFTKAGTINGFIRGIYISNHTDYSGSAIASDRAITSRVGTGVSYSVILGNFYGATGFGWDWDRFQLGKMVDRQSYPWYDLSLQYTLKQKHSFSTVFHYSNWPPSPNFKSDIIVQSSPFMSYTGNPNLIPNISYDFSFDYTWIPNNNYSLSAYGWGWVVSKRYAYDYEASSTGILRTIKQPIGSFAQGKYGVMWTMRFLDRSLVFSGNLSQILNHNGEPYNINHSAIDWYARLRYYLNNWVFTLTYSSPSENSEDKMSGKWMRDKSFWYVTIGWSNDKWNIRGDLFNLTRWNWKDQSITMKSPYYSTNEVLINGNSRAFVQLSATYTFGFGKKVKRDNEPTVSNSTSSGILK